MTLGMFRYFPHLANPNESDLFSASEISIVHYATAWSLRFTQSWRMNLAG